MPAITEARGEHRIEVDPRPPYFDKCAFHSGQLSGPDGYVEGRTVKGYGADDSLAFLGRMCLSCMRQWGIERTHAKGQLATQTAGESLLAGGVILVAAFVGIAFCNALHSIGRRR